MCELFACAGSAVVILIVSIRFLLLAAMAQNAPSALSQLQQWRNSGVVAGSAAPAAEAQTVIILTAMVDVLTNQDQRLTTLENRVRLLGDRIVSSRLEERVTALEIRLGNASQRLCTTRNQLQVKQRFFEDVERDLEAEAARQPTRSKPY